MSLRLQLVSDLHLGRFPDADAVDAFCRSLLTDADVLCIAGDTGTPGASSMSIALDVFCQHYPLTILATGNHEYYSSNFDVAHKRLARLRQRYKDSLLVGTKGSSVQVQGTRIHACTLWFQYRPTNPEHWMEMADAHLIETGRSPDLILHGIEQRGEASVRYLMRHVKVGDVVVTHHMPHPATILPNYRDNPLNAFYLNDGAQQVIDQKKPALWMFGHTHTSIDTQVNGEPTGVIAPWGEITIGGTRLLSNPHGYLGPHQNRRFRPHLVVEIP